MADAASDSAPVPTADSKSKGTAARPEKPDEEEYKENVEKAQKELDKAQERLVSIILLQFVSLRTHSLRRLSRTQQRLKQMPSVVATRTLRPNRSSKHFAPSSDRSVNSNRVTRMLERLTSARLMTWKPSSRRG